jgi:hypothetical protein
MNEQRREIAHVQQRSVGLAECNRWKSNAVALQNGNSHPAPDKLPGTKSVQGRRSD